MQVWAMDEGSWWCRERGKSHYFLGWQQGGDQGGGRPGHRPSPPAAEAGDSSFKRIGDKESAKVSEKVSSSGLQASTLELIEIVDHD